MYVAILGGNSRRTYRPHVGSFNASFNKTIEKDILNTGILKIPTYQLSSGAICKSADPHLSNCSPEQQRVPMGGPPSYGGTMEDPDQDKAAAPPNVKRKFWPPFFSRQPEHPYLARRSITRSPFQIGREIRQLELITRFFISPRRCWHRRDKRRPVHYKKS